MPKKQRENGKNTSPAALGRLSSAVAVLLSAVLVFQGCFDPVYPQFDREARIMEALDTRDTRDLPETPLTASQAVAYALSNSIDARVAEIEKAYHDESAIAARRRLLPALNLRYSMEHSNHPGARWSQSTRSGNQSLESSFSSDPNSRQGEVGMMWNVIDFGVGYLRARQQGERIRHSEMQRRRVRQQVVLDVLTNYWRASAAVSIANEAEELKKELDAQAESIRDSVEMRILSGAEGARRELAVHGGLAELEQWRRTASQARLELARVMGSGNALDFTLAEFPSSLPELPPLPGNDATVLQTAALRRRPELYQQDAQERIAVDEARLALLQMAPNATLSLSLYDDPDKYLEWNNWMTVGARVSWNLFNIPARLSERRMAKLQGETAKQKGLALAAAIMAQVGIAFSDWRLSQEYAKTLAYRADARARLVEALAAGEKDGQTRPGEVLQERVRLLSERAAAHRAAAEVRIAGARLANAIGLDVDAYGRLIWELGDESFIPPEKWEEIKGRGTILHAEERAQQVLPDEMAGLPLVKADDFKSPEEYFEYVARTPEINHETDEAMVADSEPEVEIGAIEEGEAVWSEAPAYMVEEERDDFLATSATASDAGEYASLEAELPAEAEGESAWNGPQLFAPVVPPASEDVAYDYEYEDYPEPVNTMAPPAGESMAGLRPLPKTSFVGNDSPSGPKAEVGAHGSSAMSMPYFSREIPMDFDSRTQERQRALEPLPSFADSVGAPSNPLEQIQDLIVWPEPLSGAVSESFMEFQSFADAADPEPLADFEAETWVAPHPDPEPVADPLASLRPSAATAASEPASELTADLRPGSLFGAVPGGLQDAAETFEGWE